MIFPESELSTYLGFFVPGGQVEPLLDRIAEASSEFEELNLVGFLHLAQRELELTGDVNRDDAAVVLIEELQLPLADAASVLEENPAATAARLQSAWAEVPDQHTGPLPNLLQDGLIMLEPGLELDESLVLDPSLSIITPKPAGEAKPVVPEAPEEGEADADPVVEGSEPEVPEVAEPVAEAEAFEGEAFEAETLDAAVGEEPGDARTIDATPVVEELAYTDAPEAIEADEAVDEEAPVVEEPGDEPEPEVVPEVVVEVIAPEDEPLEPELVIAPEPEGHAADGMVGVQAVEPERVPGPGLAFSPDADEVYEPVPEEAQQHTDELAAVEEDQPADEPANDQGESGSEDHNPYAALSPESLEGSSQSFPWNPNDHGQPITAASLLALDDDPVLTQGPSQPITHVTGRIPVAEILDGETDGIAAFPSHHVASEMSFPTHDPEAEVLASLLLDATGRGDTLVYEDDAPTDDTSSAEDGFADVDQADAAVLADDEADEAVLSEDVAEPLLTLMDEDEPEGEVAFDLMDAFGETGMPDQTPEAAPALSDQPAEAADLAFVDESEANEAPAAGIPDDGQVARKVITPYWMRGRKATTIEVTPSPSPSLAALAANELPGEATAQWGSAEIAEANWADQPFPNDTEQHHGERDGEDTQQLPAMDLIAEIAAENEHAVIGANLAPDQVMSPSVERFLDDLHGSWIAGGNDILQRPVSDVPLGGRFELADPPSTIPPAAAMPSAPAPSVPPPPRPKPAASGAELTNDEAVEATYEEEFVPEPPAPAPPPPAAVWIPGMADRAFRSTPWHQIEDDAEADAGDTPDLHGFGAAAFTPARPVVRQSPAEKIQEADVAAFMAGGPADAPEWDGPEEGTWAHADYGPKRPKANRAGQVSGLLALALAAGVVYLFVSWPPFQSAITALGLPVHPLVVVGALAGVLGIGGLSMFIGSSIPKQPKVKVVRRRRRKRRDEDPMGAEDTYLDDDQGIGEIEAADADSDESAEVLTDVWEEDIPNEN